MESLKPRPSWDEYYMNFAKMVATRSPDKTKVGAVLVSLKNNRVISTGYNGLAAGVKEDSVDWKDRDLVRGIIIHAETNCLLYSGSKFKKAVLYCTLSPCKECVKLLSSAQVKKVVYEREYKDFDESKKICDFFGIELVKYKPTLTVLKDELSPS